MTFAAILNVYCVESEHWAVWNLRMEAIIKTSREKSNLRFFFVLLSFLFYYVSSMRIVNHTDKRTVIQCLLDSVLQSDLIAFFCCLFQISSEQDFIHWWWYHRHVICQSYSFWLPSSDQSLFSRGFTPSSILKRVLHNRMISSWGRLNQSKIISPKKNAWLVWSHPISLKFWLLIE